MTSPSAFAMQLAWHCLQGTMQWQQLQVYNFGFDGSAEAGFEGENLYEEPDWPADCIDIVEDLLKVSNHALLLIDEAIVQSEALREELLFYMRTTFESVMSTPANDLRGACDDLESRIATVLTQLENDEAPKLEGLARDTLILLCSRGLDKKIMRGRGMPQQLVSRICAAFATAAGAMPDEALWSKLGNAKFHVFTKGSPINTHRRFKKVPRQRKLWKTLADEAAGSSAAAASSSAAAASPLPPPLPLEFLDDEWWGHGAGGMQAASSSAAAASPLPPPLALEFFDDEWCILYKF